MAEEGGQQALEWSKLEYLAQKQNRVAQHLLNDRLLEINRQMAICRLSFRMHQRELKYDLALVKQSTGYSAEARPPTGLPDTRRPARRQNRRLPGLVSRQRDDGRTNQSVVPGSGVTSLGMTSTTDTGVKLTDETIDQLTDSVTMEMLDEHAESADPFMDSRRASQADFFLTQQDEDVLEVSMSNPLGDSGVGEIIDIRARLDESKRIMNMPSIYQTQNLVNQQDFKLKSRVLPPIYKAPDESDAEEPVETPNDVENDPKQPEPANIRPKQTVKSKSAPSEPLRRRPVRLRDISSPDKRKPQITQILEASLRKAAKEKADTQRRLRNERMNKKLAIEQPVGLFRPDNVHLIQKTFKKEELYTQHKKLLENNTSSRHLPIDKMVGRSAVLERLNRFMSTEL